MQHNYTLTSITFADENENQVNCFNTLIFLYDNNSLSLRFIKNGVHMRLYYIITNKKKKSV